MRDLMLFLFLTVGFGIPFKLLFEFMMGRSYSATRSGSHRCCFAVPWIAVMEVYARHKALPSSEPLVKIRWRNRQKVSERSLHVEEERKITDIEEVARQTLESNWDNVLRTTPNAIEQFEQEYPKLCEEVNRRVQENGIEALGNVFRPGVPDFLAFDDHGDYSFVEVKGAGDGLRHSQLKWFREFQEVECEIWFADSNEGITEKMESDKLEAYTLKKPETANTGEAEIEASDEEGFLNIQLPETLAAVMNLKPGDTVSWNVKDRKTLELDTD
jgi:hypothetical protein